MVSGVYKLNLEVSFREIEDRDVEKKVKWYNDKEISRYLHYEDKFTIEGTREWLKKISSDSTRYENVIEVKDGDSIMNIGIIGLFNIDYKNKKAGYYITIGEKTYQGKGLAKKVTMIFLNHCFEKFDLEKIYLFTDTDNIVAKNLYENVGFKQEGKLRNELYHNGKFISRYYYGILKKEFLNLI